MATRGVIVALLGAFAICGAQANAPTTQNPQLRGSNTKAGEVTLRVFSKASFPVTLANCDGNHTVPALQEYASTVAVSRSKFFWVVPEGATWDCESGCPECFYLALGLEQGGGLLARLGYETSDHDDAGEALQHNDSDTVNKTNASHSDESHGPNAMITGMELIVTQADNTRVSSSCGESACSPDWERDHSIPWNSTMDLIVQGSTHSGSPNVMLLGHWHAGGGHWHAGGGHWHAGGGRYYRPPVWRRPVWRRPIYHPYHPYHR